MAINETFIGSVGVTNSSSGSSQVFSSYNQPAHELIVIGTQTNESAGLIVSSISDTAGNSFSRAFASQGFNAFGTNFMQFWYAPNCLANASNVISINYNQTGFTFCMGAAYHVSGIAASSPLDTTTSNTGASSTSMVSGSYTTTSANEFLAAFIIFANADSILSNNKGYTIDAAVIPAGGNAASANKVVSSILTAESVTFTANTAAQWGVITASFKAPSASGNGVQSMFFF